MSTTKYPILDDAFDAVMLEACYGGAERGLIRILSLTGMHVSALCKLTPASIIPRGSLSYIAWKRPKTNKTMEALLPKRYHEDVYAFIASRRLTRWAYNIKLKQIGERAGYPGISTMTFRHNRCVRAIKEHQGNPMLVAQIMGCTVDVVFRNYSKLSEMQLADKERDAELEGR